MAIQNRKKMKAKRWIGSVFLLLLFASCSTLPTYEKVYVFENNQWDQSVKPQFVVSIDDTTKTYNFTLTLRTTTDYAYSNLWVYLSTLTPDKQRSREPFEIKITDANGAWIGKKTGSIVEHSIHFTNRKLPAKGNYVFTLEQGITQSTINQVLDVGMEVTEFSENKE